MDKKLIKKLIKNEFGEFLHTEGFVSKSETLFLKVTPDNVLHIINFDLGSIGFTCAIAMQPLYTFEHTKVVSLSMGERLSRFRIVQKEWWSYDEPEKGVSEIKELLIKNGLPWFEQYGTPFGIVEFIATGKVKEYGLKLFDSFHQKQYLGFSLLYTGRIDEGIKCIYELISEISDTAAEFILTYKGQLVDLITQIKNQPDKTLIIIDDIVKENKRCLKI